MELRSKINVFVLSMGLLVLPFKALAYRPSNFTMINNVQGTVATASSIVDAAFISGGSIQAILSGTTIAGTVNLQGSNDPFNLLPGGTTFRNWSHITGTAISQASVTAGTTLGMISFLNLGYRWLRVTWIQPTAVGIAGSTAKLTVNGYFMGF